MAPRMSGNTKSRSSEGSNKSLSFKRRIPNLKMLILMIRKRPKMMVRGHSQDDISMRVMKEAYRSKRLNISTPSLHLLPLLYKLPASR
jgi:hypothetical protein